MNSLGAWTDRDQEVTIMDFYNPRSKVKLRHYYSQSVSSPSLVAYDNDLWVGVSNNLSGDLQLDSYHSILSVFSVHEGIDRFGGRNMYYPRGKGWRAPALAVLRGNLWASWVPGPHGGISIQNFLGEIFHTRETCRFATFPTMTCYHGGLLIGWTRTDDRINIMDVKEYLNSSGLKSSYMQSDSVLLYPKLTFNVRSQSSPTLGAYSPWIGWRGAENAIFIMNFNGTQDLLADRAVQPLLPRHWLDKACAMLHVRRGN